MARPRVLIIAPQGDSHVPFVLPHLARLGAEVFQLELAQLPRQARIAAHLGRAHPSWTCQLEANQQRVALEELTSIWNRRRGALHRPAYCPDPLFPPAIQTFVQAETRAGMEGIWKSLPVLHVNAPEATTVAEYKPYQLQVALACGLTIPDTCLTNDPATARQFLDAHDGRVVYKTLSRALIPQAGQHWWLYTSQIEARHRAELERVRPMLHLFQQRIEKRLELRVTIIGEAIFAAEIYSQHAERTRLDWRRSYEDLATAFTDSLPRWSAGSCASCAGWAWSLQPWISLCSRMDSTSSWNATPVANFTGLRRKPAFRCAPRSPHFWWQARPVPLSMPLALKRSVRAVCYKQESALSGQRRT